MDHDRAPTVRPSTAEPRKYGRNNLVNVATLWSYVMILTRYKYEFLCTIQRFGQDKKR